ncbi:hypothetical protein [Fodinicola acaciae]|uniref:hypothetical protein n=1 Tax=Fodinicola acaciae TaxID=2681555 RepID=UPI0013D4BC9B|nr:hypothetical protein [Fodinicola acaciae]
MGFYLPGLGLEVWVGDVHVELIGARCQCCGANLLGLGQREAPERIGEWQAMSNVLQCGRTEI